MRPIIDLNNLWYSEETLVYNSRFSIIIKFIGVIVLFGFGLYSLAYKQYLIALVFLFCFGLLFRNVIKSIAEKDIVQLRITAEGIRVKEGPLIKWEDIQDERMKRVVIKGEGDDYDFIFYDSKNDKQHIFRVGKLNVDQQELLKSVTMHRERFNRKNNPS